MKNSILISLFLSILLYSCSNKETFYLQEINDLKNKIITLETENDVLKNKPIENISSDGIKHMVIFNLKHKPDAPETHKFLQDGRKILSNIGTVKDFEVFNQVSKKNKFNFCFSMRFENQEDYEAYNLHPEHIDFVENRWKKEVSDFLEIDLKTF